MVTATLWWLRRSLEHGNRCSPVWVPAFGLSEQLRVQTNQIMTSLDSTAQMLFYLCLPFPQHWATFFGQPISDQEAACNLGSIRQGNNRVFDNVIRSLKLTTENRRSDKVLADSLIQEMKGRLELATCFKALVKLAIKVDNWLQERARPLSVKSADAGGGILVSHTWSAFTPGCSLTPVQTFFSPEKSMTLSNLTHLGANKSFMDQILPHQTVICSPGSLIKPQPRHCIFHVTFSDRFLSNYRITTVSYNFELTLVMQT